MVAVLLYGLHWFLCIILNHNFYKNFFTIHEKKIFLRSIIKLRRIFFFIMLVNGSARVCTPVEEEKSVRATEKVKTRPVTLEAQDDSMEEVSGVKSPPSFSEVLMNIPGLTGDDEAEEDFVDWDEAELPENRWYKEPAEEEGASGLGLGSIPEIFVSDKELIEWSQQWNLTLIINVMGRKVNFRALENKLNRDWARTGPIQIIDMPRGFYAVKFSKEDDYNHVLFEGPWMIADHYILIQRWRRNFLSSARVVKKVVVWVRIPDFPLELYNKKFLTRLGASLGMLLKINQLTSIHSRGKFARICVEMDLEKPVVPQVRVRSEILKLEYEGLQIICFHCGVCGHKESECNRKVVTPTSPAREEGRNGTDTTVVSAKEGGSLSGVSSPEISGRENSNLLRSDKDQNPKAAIAEMIRQHATFGPWIVVSRKKNSKRRNDKPWRSDLGYRDNQTRGKAVLRGDDENLRVKQTSLMEVDMSGGVTLDASLVKEVTSGLVPILEKTRTGPTSKNIQVGPTVRDAKRAARNVGPYIKNVGHLKGSKTTPPISSLTPSPVLGPNLSTDIIVEKGHAVLGPFEGESLDSSIKRLQDRAHPVVLETLGCVATSSQEINVPIIVENISPMQIAPFVEPVTKLSELPLSPSS